LRGRRHRNSAEYFSPRLSYLCSHGWWHCILYLRWEDFTFSALFQEQSIDYHAIPTTGVNISERYMNRMMADCYSSKTQWYLIELIGWLEFESKIVGLRRSRRFVQYPDVLSKCLSWYEENTYTTKSGRWWQTTYTCEGKGQQPK
jgi:hypothetical protein